MRADVQTEAAKSQPSVQLDPGGRGTSCTNKAGKNSGSLKDQRATAMVQQCKQEKARNPQTTQSPEGKVVCSFGRLPTLSPERLQTAKAIAEKAIKMHKIFCVQGPYPVIRAALRARGWVERKTQPPSHHKNRQHRDPSKASSTDTGEDDGDSTDENEEEQGQDGLHDLMSCLVRKEMVYFYWTNRRDSVNNSSLQKEQITNHFARAGSFSTKVGLCVNLRNLLWFDSAESDTFFPRAYMPGSKDEKFAFIEDYRRTACTSLLKYIVERAQCVHGQETICKIGTIQSKRKGNKRLSKPLVPSHMIDLAMKVCHEFLESLDHCDIDQGLGTQQVISKQEWAEFIDDYYRVVHGGAELDVSDHIVDTCKTMLQKLGDVCPQLDIEGLHNIWIIKPGAQSRGRGIKCCKRLDQILKLVDGPSFICDSKWVVQKYLEDPFLVHGTKFDMRQWFLVTDWNPLTVWFYKKCYLRFCTQPYSLDKLDSSVHLCNNSIQKNLRPSQQRHHSIPADNMWSDEQFRNFLSSQGLEAQWKTVVIPGMKKAVIQALQTTQDLMDSRKNTFELYGADFMLGCDLHPWLLEINVSPAMAPSTPVTAKLCAAVQEDTLRVVLDRKADRTASTGDFELIYRQAAVEVPHYVGINLLVEGSKIKCPRKLPPLRSSNRPAPKQRGHVKDKGPAVDKAQPLKKSFKVKNLKTTNTGVRLSPPQLKPRSAEPALTHKLHLPMTVDKSIHLPTSA